MILVEYEYSSFIVFRHRYNKKLIMIYHPFNTHAIETEDRKVDDLGFKHNIMDAFSS